MRRHAADRAGTAEVIRVLGQVQAGFVLLGGLGEMLLMGGNPTYLLLPIVKVVLLFVFLRAVVRDRRWGMIAMIVLQGLTVAGFWVQVAAGLLPWLDFTVNLMVLVTNLAMPVAAIWLCIVLLATRPASGLPAPQDPFAGAPLVPTLYPPTYVPVPGCPATRVYPAGEVIR